MPRSRRLASLLVTAAIAALLVPANPGRAESPPEPELVAAGVSNEPRGPIPEDRYALAGGCYVIKTGERLIDRDGGGYVLGDEGSPFYFQATDLGSYLLYDRQQAFFAASDGALGPVLDTLTKSRIGTPAGDLSPGEIVGGLNAEHTGEIAQYEYESEKAGRDNPDEYLPAESTDEAADEARRSDANAGRAESVIAAEGPSELSDWIVEGPAGGPYKIVLPTGSDRTEERDRSLDVELAVADGTLGLVAGGEGDDFSFALAEGCERYPEIDINVDGAVLGGKYAFQEVRGTIDLHLHGMAFEFIGGRSRCGRPWHRYGAPFALVDCPDHHPGGFGAALEGVLSNGSPDGRHNTDGWPTFAGWPTAGSLTHEQVYYRWLERAWRGGLRLVTNLLVDNNQLCKIYPYKRNSCNEMDGVRLQAQRLREFERYIDAQNGGPGEGWFRIVTDPTQAREVMNDGKLAVVMGIEVSRLFDCSSNPRAPVCTPEIVEERLDEVYDMGVRQMELVNKFDNQFSGVTFDGGTAGPVVNVGNFGENGTWYKVDDCADVHAHHEHGAADKTQMNVHDHGTSAFSPFTGRDGIFAAVIDTVYDQAGDAPYAAPVYPGGPHCNRIGLTDLGKFLVAEMAERGMVFDPDHMSVRARYAALEFLADTGGKDPVAAALYQNPKFHGLPYSGVASSHSWADDGIYQKIYELGGVVTPAGDDAADFVEKWEEHRAWYDDRYVTGFGFGSDTNGFSAHGGPSAIDYPFTGFGGATFDRQYSGPAPAADGSRTGKTYDLNQDGVAHYGLFADWFTSARSIAEERQLGNGSLFWDDMFMGAEAYLQMWERAVGVPPNACRPDVPDLTDEDLSALSEGMSVEDVLWALGQPETRADTTFTYCLSGDRTATLEFTPEGALATWTGKGEGDEPQTTTLVLADAVAHKSAPAIARATLTSDGVALSGKTISFYVQQTFGDEVVSVLLGSMDTIDGSASFEIHPRYVSKTARPLHATFSGDADFLGSTASALVYRR